MKSMFTSIAVRLPLLQSHLYLFSVLLLMMLATVPSYSQTNSYLGLNGGFEGAATIVNGTTNASPVATNWTKSTTTATIVNETATVRSGANALKVTSNSATLCRVFSPLMTVAASTTAWQVQYYRRATNTTNTVQNQSSNYRGSVEQSNGVYSSVAAANTWEKVTYSPTTTTSATSAAANLLVQQKGTGGDMFYDDFVLYESATVDLTAPNSATAVTVGTATTSNLTVGWTAATGGVDGGGYMVVRYTTNPNADNDPNVNGIYAVGNTITNGTGALQGTVRFVGTGTSFVDSGLTAGVTYYYKVYSYDKAYNYAAEAQQSGTTLLPSLTSFTPSNGCTGTSIVITGTNFNGATAVTFGGTAATSFVVNSNTQITAVVGAGTSGDVAVTVAGATTSLSGFTTSAPYAPTISAGGSTTFCSGGNVVLTAAMPSSVTDLSFTTISVGVSGTDLWQSFVPTVLGATTAIQLYKNGISLQTGTLSIYSGVGVTGALIFSGAASATNTGFFSVSLPNLNLLPGNNYTFRWQGSSIGLVANNSSYGTFSQNGVIQATNRLDFITTVVPTLGSYQWYNNSSAIGGATSATYTATSSGVYTAMNTVSGCSSAASNSSTVTVNPLPTTPTITAGGPTTFCSGGNVVLTSSAGTSYLWSTGATTQSITVSSTGSYTVRVTDAIGCQSALSTATTVTVNPLPTTPTITAGGSTTICSGSNVVLTSSAGTSYLWSTGATTQSITVSTAGSYTVRVTDANGCQSAISTATTVTVNALPTTPTITAGGSTTFCSGGNVVLTSSAGTSYLWSTGATTQSITVSTAGSYTVRVTNANGCQSAASTATTITVNPLPTAPTISAGGSTTFCSGGSVVLSSSTGTGNLWSTGETTQSITVSTAGSYTVRFTNANGCQSVASAATTVTVNALPATPTIGTGGSPTFCSGGSVVLISSTGTSYLWSNGATTQNITVSTAGNYTVRVTNANGCQSAASLPTTVTVNALPARPTITASGSTTICSGSSVVLTSSAATGYLWSTGATTQSITVSTAGNYTVTVTNSNGCQSLVSLGTTVSVNALPSTPTITAGGSTTFCSGGNVVLTSSVGTSYLWSTGATTQSITASTSGSYTVRVTNANGCQSVASTATTVTVNPLPTTPTITAGGPTTFCSGGNVVLTSSVAPSYLWSTGETTQSITVSTTGSYTVRVINSNGCQSDASAATTTTVNASPTPTISGTTEICTGSSTTLDVGGGYSSYLWSTGATTQTISVNTAGTYTVTVTNSNGCSATSTPVSIIVNPTPTPAISGTTSICAGGTTTLSESSVGTQPTTGTTDFILATPASGSVSTCNCPMGYVAVGYQGRVGDFIDQVQLACKKLNPDGTLGTDVVYTCVNGTSEGVDAAGPYFLPGNDIMVGIDAQQGGSSFTSYISSLTVQGHSYAYIMGNGQNSTNPSVATTLQGVVIASSLYPVYAPNGTVVTGMAFYDSLGSVSNIGLNYTSLANFQNQASFLWSNGETTQSIAVNSAGTYTVAVTNSSGCSGTSAAVSTIVNPIPTATISGTTTICAGSATVLDAGNGYSSYLWSTGATTQSISASTAGNYTVKVTDANGCESAFSPATLVTVNPLPSTPTITAGGSTTFCSGGSVVLTSSVGTSYLWSTGETTQSISVSTAGDYTVRVTDANGCQSALSAITTITIPTDSTPPSISCPANIVINNTPGQCGANANFSVAATDNCGSVNISYSITSGSFFPLGTTNVIVTATDSSSNIATCSFTVTVNDTTLPIISCPQNVTIQSLPGMCAATVSVSKPSVIFSSCLTTPVLDQVNYNSDSGSAVSDGYVSQSFTPNYSGKLRQIDLLLISANGGTSGTLRIYDGGNFVSGLPSGALLYSQMISLSNNAFNTFILDTAIEVVAGHQYTFRISNGITIALPISYSNSYAGGRSFVSDYDLVFRTFISNYYTITNSFNNTSDASGIYGVGTTSVVWTATDANGNSSSCTQTVSVLSQPILPTITANGSTTFCAGSSVVLTSSAGISYLWSNGATTQSITVTTGGSYTVQVTGSCYTATSDAVTVVVNPLPNLSITGNTTITCGEVATLTLNGADAISWGNVSDRVPVAIVPLDQVTNATLAVGLRRLKSSYNGPCLRLKRSTDGAEMDFGFAGNYLDKNAISNWLSQVANSQALCITLYDQSGNNGHVVYNGQNFRAPILTLGSFGVPVLHFNTNQFLTNSINYPTSYTAIYGATQTGGSRQRVLSSKYNNWLLGFWGGRMSQAYFEGWVSNPTTPADNNIKVYSGTSNGITSQLYENTSLVVSNNMGVTGPNGLQINGWQGGANETSDFDFTDVMIFNSVLTTEQRNYVEYSIGKFYYGIGTDFALAPTSTTTYAIQGVSFATRCSNTTNVTITVNANPPSVNYASVNNTYLVDTAVSIVPTTVGYSNIFSISPALPLGLSLNKSSGVISGIPTGVSTATTYTVTVQNNCGSATTTITFATICNTLQPTISNTFATICPGSSITLTSSTANNYLWSTGQTTQSITVNVAGSYTVSTGSNQCALTSNPITIQNAVIPGNPSVYGNNEWNVYAWNSGGNFSANNPWINYYSGYYTASGVNFNTQNQWLDTPSDAPGYQGCPVNIDYHSWSAKRQGFPSNLYSIDINGHDDSAELYINGVLVWDHQGCCDAHAHVWQGFLGANDQVEFRGTEGVGGSNGQISFNVVVPIISPNGSTSICSGGSVVLTSSATPLTGYLWSNGATTQSITVAEAGDYSVQFTSTNFTTAPSEITTVVINPTPVVSIAGSTSICLGDSVTLTANGASNYIWDVNTATIPLDLVGNASLAIGLRKLKTSYSGPAIRLRRSSDDVEADFGFSGNNLDIGAISGWLNGATGYCVTLYDQSGNGGDVGQYYTFQQPTIVLNGYNGRPVLHFNTNQFLINHLEYTTSYTAIYGARQTGGTRRRVLSSNYNNWLLGYWGGAKSQAHFDGWVSTNPGTPAADDNYYVYSGASNGVTSQLYENGTLLENNSGGVSAPNGIELNGLGQGLETSDVDFTDVMMFSSVLSDIDRSIVENSIRDYYSQPTTQSITVTPTENTTYTVTGYNATGCSSTSSVSITFNTNCSSIVNLKLNIEGYYDTGIGSMRSVKNNQDYVSPTDEVEDLTIELRDAQTYDIMATSVATLHTDGTLSAVFAPALSGSYYIVVKGRNMVQTWSASPQTIGATPLTYDFTTAATQAYGDNMREVGLGVWSFYSGDINQDQAVDNSDSDTLFPDIENSNFGILATDLNGDGAVDNSDTDAFFNNVENSIYSNHP